MGGSDSRIGFQRHAQIWSITDRGQPILSWFGEYIGAVSNQQHCGLLMKDYIYFEQRMN